jgi:SNF family Na+-dependent transporter
MRSMQHKSPGITVLKILCGCFLVAVMVVSLSGPFLDKLDEWSNNPWNQLWTVIALLFIVFVSWIFWRVKK